MGGMVKDNELLAEIDLDLMGELLDFCEQDQDDSIANIVVLEFEKEENSKKVA